MPCCGQAHKYKMHSECDTNHEQQQMLISSKQPIEPSSYAHWTLYSKPNKKNCCYTFSVCSIRKVFFFFCSRRHEHNNVSRPTRYRILFSFHSDWINDLLPTYTRHSALATHTMLVCVCVQCRVQTTDTHRISNCANTMQACGVV